MFKFFCHIQVFTRCRYLHAGSIINDDVIFLSEKMVVCLDIDRYLNKKDFRLCIFDCKWPWKTTHFLRSDQCFICHRSTNRKGPTHFIMLTDNASIMLTYKWFWCKSCHYAIYEHYTEDECDFCVQE